jgi:hypothetical protein
VRELQSNELSEIVPISFEIMSVDDKNEFVKELIYAFDHLNINDFDVASPLKRERLREIGNAIIKEDSYFPVVLSIHNRGQIGLRNVYIELKIDSSVKQLEISTTPETNRYEIVVKKKKITFETDKLTKSDGQWTLTIEWDALQAQRRRIIESILYIYILSGIWLNRLQGAGICGFFLRTLCIRHNCKSRSAAKKYKCSRKDSGVERNT